MSAVEVLKVAAEAHGLEVRAAYTPPQAARLLGIGENSVYNFIHSGRLRAVRVEKRFYIPASELARFLEGEQDTPGVEARGR
ncbi:helix-turn-helix domain-containing protein [Thermus sp.]|uniref:helix-turn-helix domain-containing protein n=1 Tax=Thermus sp. TaxID=275 RepID=UPI003D0D99DE